MRANFLWLAEVVFLLLFVGVAETLGQPPGTGKNPPGLTDDENEILKQIREAYKAPFEVHEDVLKELRKSYQQPSPEREAKIFKELRRLYLLTPEREMAILREIRRAYEQPSDEQEQRIFREISRAEQLPHGAVAPSVQADQAGKLFRKFDLDGDGLLGPNEISSSLRAERNRWDANRDGFIDQEEFWAYYQGRLGSLSERVVSGEIELKPGRGVPEGSTVPTGVEEPRPVVHRAGRLPPGLPRWFVQLDADGDGQIGLYEWKKTGRPFKEFHDMDLNNDGFVTAEELLRLLAQQSRNRSDGNRP